MRDYGLTELKQFNNSSEFQATYTNSRGSDTKINASLYGKQALSILGLW
jgi:hypothetical protein